MFFFRVLLCLRPGNVPSHLLCWSSRMFQCFKRVLHSKGDCASCCAPPPRLCIPHLLRQGVGHQSPERSPRTENTARGESFSSSLSFTSLLSTFSPPPVGGQHGFCRTPVLLLTRNLTIEGEGKKTTKKEHQKKN